MHNTSGELLGCDAL